MCRPKCKNEGNLVPSEHARCKRSIVDDREVQTWGMGHLGPRVSEGSSWGFESLVLHMKENSNYLEEYHELSNRIGGAFDAFIEGEIAKREDKDDLLLLYEKFLASKRGKAHFRPMLVYIAARLFGVSIDENFKNIFPVMTVPELGIWSNYALNWVTDEKNNVSGTKYEENIDLVASQYLLTEALYFLPDRMLKKYLEWYRWCMRGYLTVERDLTITNFEKIESEGAFWKAYSRNHSIPDVGGLYAYCFDIVDEYFELHTPAETMAKIRKINLEFGRSHQIDGDLSDFIIPNEQVSTTEKRPQKDYFIDIRTDRLTYPIWLLLKKSKAERPELFEEVKKVARERAYGEGFYARVHAFLKETKIVEEVLGYTRKERNRLRQEIDKLGIKNKGAELWKSALAILTDNKFVRQLKMDYGLVK